MVIAKDDHFCLLQNQSDLVACNCHQVISITIFYCYGYFYQMDKSILIAHRNIWKKKAVLRALYSDWYATLIKHLKPGRSLEVGGGSGNLKEYIPHVISTDIVQVPWLDIVADAHKIPFINESFMNIILFDVLHHIENSTIFFTEAIRILIPEGNIIIMDPYVSLISWPVYHFLHSEPVNFLQNPLESGSIKREQRPFDANQAISKLLFEKHFRSFKQRFPQLTLTYKHYLSFIAYPLTGGFEHPSFLPNSLLPYVLKLEKMLEPFGRFFAFRILLVLKKNINN